jgi:hypothetical protein
MRTLSRHEGCLCDQFIRMEQRFGQLFGESGVPHGVRSAAWGMLIHQSASAVH